MAGPIEVLRADRAAALHLSQVAGRKRLLVALRKAERELERRLRSSRGEFSRTKIEVTLRQVQMILRGLRKDITNVTLDVGAQAAEKGVENTIRYMKAAERKFGGIAERLQLKESMLFDRALTGTRSSILHRLQGTGKGAGILDRYGDRVVEHFEKVLQQRFLTNQPWDEARLALIAESPFLQGAPASWSERILRTEVMGAHNTASWEATREANRQLKDVVKIMVATFDDRTAADSYAVHGQIRRPSEAFSTWQGMFQSPPARPNDREVTVSHRISWPIPPELAWRSDSEVAARWKLEKRKGSSPPRPRMTTVPLAKFGTAA